VLKNWSRVDYGLLGFLLIYAVFIWFRDPSWISSSDDTLPILVAIPLFMWLGSPWHWRNESSPLSTSALVGATLLFLLGNAFNLTLFLTLSWCLILWTWLSKRVTQESFDALKKLMVLPLMAFPWIALDADRIGWWFRLSGAWAAAHFFALFGFDVQREGTLMVVNQLPISVEVACAGLNTLQSMLIAGTAVAFLFLGNSSRFWWNLPLLVLISWLANTVRIILISAAALAISPSFAKGNFHVLGGWVVILLMFCLCWFIFSLQEKHPERGSP
jgi:exosortase/archaeosortase family protein